MAPVSIKQSLDLLASLGDVVPFLAPAKAVILLIAQAIEEAEDNTDQCLYLLQRCTYVCKHVDRLYQKRVRDADEGHLVEFKHALDKVKICVEHLSRKTPLQRFLQRQEISDSIRNAHGCLDGCIELFQLNTVSSLAFASDRHEAAHKKDQARLALTLEKLQKNDENILEALELRGDQLMEAVRGLRDTLRRGIDDALQRQFATTSLQTLMQRQLRLYDSGTSTLAQGVTSYDWAVSSLEILVEGEVLGSGAFGTVYAGRWNGSRVAIKKLTRGTPKQILVKEIDIWRRMQHPYIASFFRACVDSDPPLLVSEMYDFGNMMVYLAEFPDANRVNLAHEISLGMVFLHKQKIVHGDLKPANVLIDNAHRARITDFGLSKIKSSLTTQTVGNISEDTIARAPGTKVFMAPERLRRGTMSFATDVYAFAMSIYQMFTGEAPFQHLPEDEIRQVVVVDKERPERPESGEIASRGLTDGMWGLVERCWADDRKERPKFDEVATVIEPWTILVAPQKRRAFDERHASSGRAVSIPARQQSVGSVVHYSHVEPELDKDEGIPLQIPGTEVVISAQDFRSGHSPGFGDLPRTVDLDRDLPPLPVEEEEYVDIVQPFGESESMAIPDLELGVRRPAEESLGVTELPTSSESPRSLKWYKRWSRSPSSSSQNTLAPLASANRPASIGSFLSLSKGPKHSRGNSVQESIKATTPPTTPGVNDQATEHKKSKPPKRHFAKFVIVGDGACGKTSLLTAFTLGKFPLEYSPTVFDNYVADVSILGHNVQLALYDTAGQEEYETLRPLSYEKAHVFLVCFAVDNPTSLMNIEVQWIKELQHYGRNVPFILVGCKKDLRSDGKCHKRGFVSRQQAEETAKKLKAVCYVECSALNGEGVTEVFRTSTTCALGTMLKEREEKEKTGCIVM